MKKRLTTAQLRYSSVVRLFLLLLCVCGSNNVWASEEYLPVQNGELVTTSGTVALEVSTTAQTIQATTHVQVTYGMGGWTVNGSKVTGSALASNGSGEYSYNNYVCPTSGAYIVLTPSASGTIEVRGIKEGGGNKYMAIQTSNTHFLEASATVTCGKTPCAWTSDDKHHGYKFPDTSSASASDKTFTASFSVEAGLTYYITFDKFSNWSFTGFTFTEAAIDIANSDFGFVYTTKNTYLGETFEGNLFVNRHNVSVSYSSSDKNVATVNASTGDVTLVGEGTTTITASFAGNSDYNAKSASYTLNVGAALALTDIKVSYLRYQPGEHGINATQMERHVGGLDLNFSGNDGIKCNNTNNFYFRTNSSGQKGVMTIALDNDNSTKHIKKIVFTAYSAATVTLPVSSVAKSSGTLTQTGTKEWTWTNFTENVSSVTFTSQGENDEGILLSRIQVYTDATPTFTKITPTPAFNRNSDNYSVGASVAISDLAINTTPGSFLFDYNFDAGTTTLTHAPITTNETWPGTITGTAVAGTAKISASFTENPFYNNVSSTDVYTLTVSSAAKNTFVWDFTKGISTVDQWLLLKDKSNDAKWVQTETNGTTWRLQNTISEAAFTQNGSTELEYAYGLQLDASASKSNLLNDNTTGFGLKKDYKLIIPNLTVGDEISITFTASKDRGIYLPTHISDGVNFGPVSANGTYTATGTITEGTENLELAAIDNIYFKNITVRRAMKPWPSMSFANGSTVNVEIPYGETSTTYTNALTNVPTGGSVTYEVLLSNASVDVPGGTVTQDGTVGIDSSTGALSNIKKGTTIVRAKFTSESSAFSDYYCDYILNATQASEFASWEYSADSKEIDGEDRPYQGSYTITKSGNIKSTDRVVTAIPGIKMTMGNLDETWYVTTIDGVHYAKTDATTERTEKEATKGNFYKFEPIVNGFLSVTGRNSLDHLYLMDGNSQVKDHNGAFTGKFTEIENYPLIAGTTYYIVSKDEFNLHSFTFRPAFLTPDKTAEQTEEFAAYSNTTAFPKLVQNADAGVRFSGNRSVVNLASDGGVTLVGGGTAIVRGRVISGENSLTASYTLNANILSLLSTNPTSGSTVTNLENNVFQFLFNENISLLDNTKFMILKDADDITSQCSININNNSSEDNYQKRLNVSGFGDLEAGSTYTIRLLAGAVCKTGETTVANAELIEKFMVDSDEPPLTWIYPSTTSAVRIGTSIVLQTSSKIDENYPSNGVWATLRYEGDDSDPDYPMQIKAIKDDNNLVFKATKSMVPNKLYSLTIEENQVKLNNSTNMITKDKVFLFTTGTGTGDIPVLTSSTPSADTEIALPTSSEIVHLYFDQNLEVEPYSTIHIIPVNGSEDLATGVSEKLVNGVLKAQTLTLDSENPKHLYFHFSSDLKYDLYYQMIIPANTVTGPGGMPNERTVVNFKVERNSNSTKVDPETFYPHTWDFNKLGDSSTDGKTAYELIEHANKYDTYGNVKNCMVSTSIDDYTTYTNRGSDNNRPFDQGTDVYIATGSSSKYKLPEFEGIRISLVKPTQNRFELRNVTSKETANKNLDGTDKWVFRMNGNTHYMTLSNVPVGKLYMVVNSPYLGINSPNATFEEVEGATISNEGTLMNTNGNTKKVVINVAQAGDVSFCLQNFNCEKIAVAAHTKTFKTTFVKDNMTYATDRLSYDVRYDLLNAFTSHNVKAYYVSEIKDNPGVNAADIIGSLVNPANAVKADQGILAVYQGAVSAETEVPIFKADVNTAALNVTEDGEGSTLKNMLKVIGNDETTFPASEEGFYNYVLAPKGTKTTGVGFYRYTGSGFSPRAAYLPIKIAFVNTGSGSSSTSSKRTRLLLLDADEQVTTAILEVKGDGIATRNNDGYYYNLNGMRVDQPKAGIYIRNGKKVVMK